MARNLTKTTFPQASVTVDGDLEVLGNINSPGTAELQARAGAALGQLITLQGSYSNFMQTVADIADDNIVSPSEKLTLKREWTNLDAEYPQVLAAGTAVGIVGAVASGGFHGTAPAAWTPTANLADVYKYRYLRLKELLVGGVSDFTGITADACANHIFDDMTVNSVLPSAIGTELRTRWQGYVTAIETLATGKATALVVRSPKYLGALAANPAVADAILPGDFYYNSTVSPKVIRKLVSGTTWSDVTTADPLYGLMASYALADIAKITLAAGDTGFAFFSDLSARNLFSNTITLLAGGYIQSANYNAGASPPSGFRIDTTGKFAFYGPVGESVTWDGTDFKVSGKIKAIAGGDIGGWAVGTGSLYYSKTGMADPHLGIYLGTDGIALGTAVAAAEFSVTQNGTLTAKKGTIGGFTLDATSIQSTNYDSTHGFRLDNTTGSITAVVGYIGPLTISAVALQYLTGGYGLAPFFFDTTNGGRFSIGTGLKYDAGSGTPTFTVGGLTVTASSMGLGSGGFNTATQPFFVDNTGGGRFSLGTFLQYTYGSGTPAMTLGGLTVTPTNLSFGSGAWNAGTMKFYIDSSGQFNINGKLILTSGGVLTIGGLTVGAASIGFGSGGYGTATQKFWVDNSNQFSVMDILKSDGTTVTIAGLSFTNANFGYGTGGFGVAAQKFFVNNAGDFSLGASFTWTAATSTLNIAGNFNLSGGVATIAGWIVNATTLESAATNSARLSLDKTNMRMGVLNSANATIVAMGYLTDLPINGPPWDATVTYNLTTALYCNYGGQIWKSKQVGNVNHTPVAGAWWQLSTDNYSASTYGFYAKLGDTVRVDGPLQILNGDMTAMDSSFIVRMVGSDVLKLGNWVGEYGLTSVGANVLKFGTNSTTRVIISATDAAMGLGRAPTCSLDVYSASASRTIMAESGLTTGYANLVAKSSGGNTFQMIMYGATATGTYGGLANMNNTAMLYADGTNLLLTVNGAGTMYFSTSNATRMWIDSSGKVGIGRTSPSALFDVYSLGATALTNIESGLAAGAGVLQLKGSGSSIFQIIQYGTSGSTYFGISGAYSMIYSDAPALVIGNASAYPLIFGTNALERMRIDSAGNVIIGKTAYSMNVPSLLEVHNPGTTSNSYANIGLSSAVTANIGYIGALRFMVSGTAQADKNAATITGSIVANSTTTVSGMMQFWTANAGAPTVKMTLSKEGYLGIGTPTPGGWLHVIGSSQLTLVLESPAYPELRFKVSTVDKAYLAITTANGGYATNSLIGDYVIRAESGRILFTYLTTISMMIDTAGNVGIGATAPTAKFEIALTGSASLAAATIVKSTDFAASSRFGFRGLVNNSDGAYFGMGADGAGIPAGIGFFREAGGWNTAMTFYTNNVTSGPNGTVAMQEKMRITSAGYVGIGNTTPHAPLHFYRGTATRKIVLYEDTDNDYQFYGFGVESNTLVYTTSSISADHVFFSSASSSSRSELMRIKGAGGVSIPGYLGVGAAANSSAKIYAYNAGTATANYGIDAEAVGAGISNYGVYAVAAGASNNYALFIPLGYPPDTAANYSIYSGSVAKSYFAGNIGIGVNATCPLHVAKSATGWGAVISNGATISMAHSNGSGMLVSGGTNTAGYYLAQFNNLAGTEVLGVYSDGVVQACGAIRAGSAYGAGANTITQGFICSYFGGGYAPMLNLGVGYYGIGYLQAAAGYQGVDTIVISLSGGTPSSSMFDLMINNAGNLKVRGVITAKGRTTSAYNWGSATTHSAAYYAMEAILLNAGTIDILANGLFNYASEVYNIMSLTFNQSLMRIRLYYVKDDGSTVGYEEFLWSDGSAIGFPGYVTW